MTAPNAETVLKVIATVAETQPADLQPSTDLQTDLGFDSLRVLELFVELENTFDVDIGTADTKQIRTVGDIVELLLRLQPKSS